jgi:hypothetical protein
VPNPDHTDESRLDLADDEAFAKLIERRQELTKIESEGRRAEIERKALDAKIIARLGNAKSASAADGALVSTQTIKRAAFTVPASEYRLVKVRWAGRAKRPGGL